MTSRSATWPIFGIKASPSVVLGILERSFPAMLLVMATLSGAHVHAATLDLETRVELQLALKNHVDAGTVDGVYEHFNVEQGQVEELTLKNLHPVIFSADNKYMMCANFLDARGDDVLLDYIVSRSGNGFRIEQEIRGRRSYLKQIFERIY
jgi:hypothetical protein